MSKTTLEKPSCEQIINLLPDPFVIIDRDYRIVAANISYQKRYNLSPEQIVGHHCYEISHHSAVPCHQHGEHCPMQHVFTRRQATQVMHVHYDKNNKEEYVRLHAAPLFGPDGDVLYMGETIYPLAKTDDKDIILVGRSPPLLRMTSLLQRVAPTQTTLLLTGESGVGKECVAQYVHHYSARSAGPFIIVDCGALDENVIESELFGHEKGAFAGASARKRGLFEAAHGGTLFIDDIGDMPLALQTKLLRVLETGTIRRIGGTEYIKVDVRIIAATNHDVQAMVKRDEFRHDLYYRLSVFPVEVPTLRERKDDIPALAHHFLTRFGGGDRHVPLSPEVIEVLLGHDYPGNVRELRHVVERAAILAGDDALESRHIIFQEQHAAHGAVPQTQQATAPTQWLANRRRTTPTEPEIIDTLRRCHGHRATAAHELGMTERSLYRYLRRIRSVPESAK
jgi:two-component system, NtrC family, response regulator AtoC